MAETWHAKRFTYSARKLHRKCGHCCIDMWLPPSKADAYKMCGPVCNKAAVEAKAQNRTRPCATCSALFTPRDYQLRHGGGTVCSQKCNVAFHRAGNTPESLEKRIAAMAAVRQAGAWTILSGEANPRWKGGLKATIKRRVQSGKNAEYLRRYRYANPDRVRGYCKRRRGLVFPALPTGCIAKIKKMQRGKCAYCKTSVAKTFHVDHIKPLTLGGEHKPRNIQILCPPCNLSKSARDPIVHMQSLGRLL